MDRLPFARDTRRFSTENASGCTSRAANIIEALEDDAVLLLIDEDTSATNFMIRDEHMQQLVASDKLVYIGQTLVIGLIMHWYAKNDADKTSSRGGGLRLALKEAEEK